MKRIDTYEKQGRNYSQSVSICKGESKKTSTEYNFSNNGTRIGGTGRTNNIIRRAEQFKSIEEKFLSFAYKLGRAENQREARRAKR